MNKSRLVKIALSVLGLFAFSLNAHADNDTPHWWRTLQKKAFHLQQTHARATSTLSAVKAAWQIYDTKTVSHRNVSVTVNWGKPTAIETYCNGVEKEGFLYIAQTCYYPIQRKGQNRQWLSSKWVVGEKEIELGQPTVNTSGLVIFELPVLSSNAQTD